jgi:hypothetical protein
MTGINVVLSVVVTALIVIVFWFASRMILMAGKHLIENGEIPAGVFWGLGPKSDMQAPRWFGYYAVACSYIFYPMAAILIIDAIAYVVSALSSPTV